MRTGESLLVRSIARPGSGTACSALRGRPRAHPQPSRRRLGYDRADHAVHRVSRPSDQRAGPGGAAGVSGQLPFLIAATPQFLEILGVTVIEGRPSWMPMSAARRSSSSTRRWRERCGPVRARSASASGSGSSRRSIPFAATGPPPPPTTVPCREVIGVARDVRQRSVVPSGSEDRLMQYFVPFSQVPPPAGVGAGPAVQGLLLRTTAGPRARRADSPPGERRPHRPAVPAGPPVFGDVRAPDAPVAPGHDAAVTVWRARARRGRGRALRGVRPLGGRAPSRDGDPHRRRRAVPTACC